MQDSIDFIKNKTQGFTPEIALVLGSGLGDFTSGMSGVEIPYSQISGFSASCVAGHKGALFFGKIENKNCVVMQGRFHYYEGHSIQSIINPIKLFKALGVKNVILTNAAGSLDIDMPTGSLMLIRDHINFMGTNPLIGKNDDSLGERFPDMSEIYSVKLRQIAHQSAKLLNINLFEGVYAATTGPSYETPAEVKMLKILGADAVGMSTVPEAIAANWLKMNVLGISLISNYAAGISEKKLSHNEVIEAGALASDKIKPLLNAIIKSV